MRFNISELLVDCKAKIKFRNADKNCVPPLKKVQRIIDIHKNERMTKKSRTIMC